MLSKFSKKILVALLINATMLSGSLRAETTATFKAPVKQENNKYGESVYMQDVTLMSNKVITGKMFGKNPYIDDIGTRVTFKVTESGSSLCSLFPGQMDKDGCSGQRPFFVNKLDDGEQFLIFNSSYGAYDNEDSAFNGYNSFFPADIDRNEKYYKDTSKENSSYSFLGRIFSSFIGDSQAGRSKFFSNVFFNTTIENVQEADIRQRYVANLMNGLDKEHRLIINESTVNLNTVNNPISLIDYSEEVNDGSKCGEAGTSLKSSAGRFFCTVPFLNWFVHTSATESYTVDTIEQDTEISLIALAGTNANISKEVVSEKEIIQKDERSSNPIIRLFSKFSCLFGGCAQREYFTEAVQEIRTYPEDKALRMEIPIVDASGKVTDIVPVKLLAIHSVVPVGFGCTFQKKSFFNWDDEVRVSREHLYEKSGFFIFTAWREKTRIDRKNKAYWEDKCLNNPIGYRFKTYSKYRISEKTNTKARSLIIKVKKINPNEIDYKNSTINFQIMRMH